MTITPDQQHAMDKMRREGLEIYDQDGWWLMRNIEGPPKYWIAPHGRTVRALIRKGLLVECVGRTGAKAYRPRKETNDAT